MTSFRIQESIGIRQAFTLIVSVSAWTMSRQGEQLIPVTGFDDKREITVILVVTLVGEHLPPHILYLDKLKLAIQQLSFHLSEICGIQNTAGLMNSVCHEKREVMGLENHSCLAIFDVFRGQQTRAFN